MRLFDQLVNWGNTSWEHKQSHRSNVVFTLNTNYCIPINDATEINYVIWFYYLKHNIIEGLVAYLRHSDQKFFGQYEYFTVQVPVFDPHLNSQDMYTIRGSQIPLSCIVKYKPNLRVQYKAPLFGNEMPYWIALHFRIGKKRIECIRLVENNECEQIGRNGSDRDNPPIMPLLFFNGKVWNN